MIAPKINNGSVVIVLGDSSQSISLSSFEGIETLLDLSFQGFYDLKCLRNYEFYSGNNFSQHPIEKEPKETLHLFDYDYFWVMPGVRPKCVIPEGVCEVRFYINNKGQDRAGRDCILYFKPREIALDKMQEAPLEKKSLEDVLFIFPQ